MWYREATEITEYIKPCASNSWALLLLGCMLYSQSTATEEQLKEINNKANIAKEVTLVFVYWG